MEHNRKYNYKKVAFENTKAYLEEQITYAEEQIAIYQNLRDSLITVLETVEEAENICDGGLYAF